MMPSIHASKSLEHRLRLRAEHLRHEIATVQERSAAPAAGEVNDAKDAADARAQGIVADAEVERDLAELREIDLALRGIDDGSYGICVDCGDPIDQRRVLAQPTALRCLECQAIAEGNTTRIPTRHVDPRR